MLFWFFFSFNKIYIIGRQKKVMGRGMNGVFGYYPFLSYEESRWEVDVHTLWIKHIIK